MTNLMAVRLTACVNNYKRRTSGFPSSKWVKMDIEMPTDDHAGPEEQSSRSNMQYSLSQQDKLAR
jgi:hypothetical protein